MFLDPLKPMMRAKSSGIGVVGYLSAGLSGATTALSAESSLNQAGYQRAPVKGQTANWFGRYRTP